MNIIDRIFDWYVPQEIRSDPIELGRAKSLVALSLAVGLATPSFALLYGWLGHLTASAVILTAGALLGALTNWRSPCSRACSSPGWSTSASWPAC